MSIPKILYTTWISDKPFPERYQKYLNGWKTLMPDYDIRIITLENCPKNKWVNKAIREKNFILAGHWARCQRLYETGGIYMDIDVEVIKPFDDLLDNDYFIGAEDEDYLNNAVMGAIKGHFFTQAQMDYMLLFDMNHPQIENETGPRMVTKLLIRYGWVPSNSECIINGIHIYPNKYFYPYLYTEEYSPSCVTKDTYTIHHWANTWSNKEGELDGISFIIPCYNHAKTLGKSIESCLSQDCLKEVIVVNDGSLDNTSEICRNYPVTLLEQENKGLSSARNLGIKNAKYDIIYPLDADDEMCPNACSNLLTEFRDADIVYMNVLHNGERIIHTKVINDVSQFLVNNQLSSCFPFRKTVWNKLGGYWECPVAKNIMEDWDFWGRACKAGFKFKYLNRDCVKYNQSEGGMCAKLSQNWDYNRDLVVDHIKKYIC